MASVTKKGAIRVVTKVQVDGLVSHSTPLLQVKSLYITYGVFERV